MEDKKDICAALRKILMEYAPPFTCTKDSESGYELYTTTPVEWKGRKYDELFFAGALIQGKFVGLYLMYVYVEPANLDSVPGVLRKCLKGKSCFHISKWDKEMEQAVKKAVKDGYNFYKKSKLI